MTRAQAASDGGPAAGRLVADCGGLIRRIALSLPAQFFGDGSQSKWFQPLVPIGNLLKALPGDIDVLLLVERSCLDLARGWAASLQAACVMIFVPAEMRDMTGGPWIQDTLHVRTRLGADMADIEILTSEAASPGASLAAFLQVPVINLPFFLPGGNQVIGPDFRLVGHSSLKPGGAAGVISTAARLAILDKLRALDGRGIHVFGYRTADLSNISFGAEERLRREDYFPGHPTPVSDLEELIAAGHQAGFHVDQFVSVTGLERNGRPLLVVGEPHVAGHAETPLVENARRLLDASVRSLVRQGFEVLRNPVPYVPTPDSGKRLPRLYNNLLLENAVRPGRARPMVWLPQFDDLEDLQEFDILNREIWEGLGFEVAPVAGLSYFASRNGALRCLSKVLQRGEWTAPPA